MTELPCDYQGFLANGHFEVYKHFSYCFSTDSKRYIYKGYCKGTSTLRKKLRSYYQFIYRQKIFKKDLITTCICKRTLIVTEGLL